MKPNLPIPLVSADWVFTMAEATGTPYRIGSHDRDELAPGLRSYHLDYSRQQAKHPHGAVKSPRHIVWQTMTDRGRPTSA